jgi:hypothetical protein
LRRSRCISVASGDTSSLPFGENAARNTFTLLRLLLNYTSNLCERMYCGAPETRFCLSKEAYVDLSWSLTDPAVDIASSTQFPIAGPRK